MFFIWILPIKAKSKNNHPSGLERHLLLSLTNWYCFPKSPEMLLCLIVSE